MNISPVRHPKRVKANPCRLARISEEKAVRELDRKHLSYLKRIGVM